MKAPSYDSGRLEQLLSYNTLHGYFYPPGSTPETNPANNDNNKGVFFSPSFFQFHNWNCVWVKKGMLTEKIAFAKQSSAYLLIMS